MILAIIEDPGSTAYVFRAAPKVQEWGQIFMAVPGLETIE
jgi:hypothetical protein